MKTFLPSYQPVSFGRLGKASMPLADESTGVLNGNNPALLKSYYPPIKPIRFGRTSPDDKAEKALAKVNLYKKRFLESYPIPEEYKSFIPDFDYMHEYLTKISKVSGAAYDLSTHQMMISKELLAIGGTGEAPLQEIVPHEIYHCINGVARAHLRQRDPELFEKALMDAFTEKIEKGTIIGTTIVGIDTSHVPNELTPKLELTRAEAIKISSWSKKIGHELMTTPGYLTEDMTSITSDGVVFMESKLTDEIKTLLEKRPDNGSVGQSLKELINYSLFLQHDMRIIKIPTPSLPPKLRSNLAKLFEIFIRDKKAYINEDIWSNDTLNEKAKKKLETLLNQPEAKAFVDTYDSPRQALASVEQYLNSFVGWRNRIDSELQQPIPEVLHPLKGIPLSEKTRKLGYQFSKDLLSTVESSFYGTFDDGNQASLLIYSVLSPEERNARKVSFKFALTVASNKLKQLEKEPSTPIAIKKAKQFKKAKAEYEANLKVIRLYEQMIESNAAAQRISLRFPAYDKASRKHREASFRFQEVQGKLGKAVIKAVPHEQLINYEDKDNLLEGMDIANLPGLENIGEEINTAVKDVQEAEAEVKKLAEKLKDHYTDKELETRFAPIHLMMAAQALLPECTESLQIELGYMGDENLEEIKGPLGIPEEKAKKVA